LAEVQADRRECVLIKPTRACKQDLRPLKLKMPQPYEASSFHSLFYLMQPVDIPRKSHAFDRKIKPLNQNRGREEFQKNGCLQSL
jgi:hypothetical protein